MKYILIILIIVLPGQYRVQAQGNPFTLNEYLAEAAANQPGLAAARKAFNAAELLAGESGLATLPAFFGEAGATEDRSKRSMPELQGNRSNAYSMDTGVKMKGLNGLEGKFYYSLGREKSRGSAFGNTDQWASTQNLELTLPLWRNLGGRETSSAVSSGRALRRAQAEAARAEADGLRLRAEQAYWHLAAARERILIASTSLTGAEELVRWTTAKTEAGLADPSDLLQAKAAAKVRQQELFEAQDLLRRSSRVFNALRGRNSDEVPVLLESVDGPVLKPPAGTKAELRAGGLYAEHYRMAAESSAEAVKPSLDLVSKITLTGLSSSQDTAMSGAFSTRNPSAGLWVQFGIPLPPSRTREVRRGYVLEAEAAGLRHKQALLEDGANLAALLEEFDSAATRLSLAKESEAAQLEKYRAERLRREKGKSTVYLILTFQDDYATAQARRVSASLELRLICAQMRLYGEAI